MKSKSLIASIATLVVVALVCTMTGATYLRQLEDDVLYMDNPGITDVLRLSDYNPNLLGTAGDVDIYVFDSGVPGGKALIYGGTHTNEVGSMLNAVTYMENAVCEEGILYVIVRANNSGYSHTQPLAGQMGIMDFDLPDGTTREFRIGTRITNPVHQWPDPNYHLNSSQRELVNDELAEIRNLNRNHPGEADGYLTEMVNNAIYEFVVQEEIDFLYDGHEAGGESVTLVNFLVVHENAMALGSAAVMNCVLENLPFKLEISGQTSYGLSHRGLGDNTNALCTLFEVMNPTMGTYKDKMSEEIFEDGISANYLALHEAGFYNSYEYTEEGSPVSKRTAYHMMMSSELINSFSVLYPDKPMTVTGLPDANYMIENGLEATLKSLA